MSPTYFPLLEQRRLYVEKKDRNPKVHSNKGEKLRVYTQEQHFLKYTLVTAKTGNKFEL